MTKSYLDRVVIRMRCFEALLATLTICVSLSGQEAKPTELPKDKLLPFLTKYCIRCHGEDDQKGQVRFDRATWVIENNDSAQRWQDVLDQLNGGDMPPAAEAQPSNHELSQMLDTLTGSLRTARLRLTDHGGEIAMRRLNRREYQQTIRHLFGFKLASHLIPEDGETESFDTVGDEQFFSSVHLEDYLKLGRLVAEQGFLWSGKPYEKVTANRRQPEERVTPSLRAKLADLDHKMRMKSEGKTWQEMGFKDRGEMEIIFRQFKNRAGKPRTYLQYPDVETGIYMAGVNNETKRFGTNRGADPRASYKFRIRGGVFGDPPEIRKHLLFSDNDGPVGVVKVEGTPEMPETVEMLVHAKAGHRVQQFHVEENRADIRVLDAYLAKVDPDGPLASIWIDWLEIEGPFYDRAKPDSVFAILTSPEKSGKQRDQTAKQFIETFAFEAFRRKKPSVEYINQLLALFETERANGASFEQAMGEVVAIILASPGFLYIHEATEKDSPTRLLNQREFAIRLSYFLWSSPPDNELYEADLSNPHVLKRQIERLLNSPNAKFFHSGFASQWADLDRFDAITVDANKYFRFNKGLRLAAYQEVLEFFAALVTHNLSATNLIDSDFVTINSLLADHYEIPQVASDAFARVTLSDDSPRGGLLGQAAFLTLGSNGERSSPVIRGATVMEKLLHNKPAPPPPNVPELGSNTKMPTSNREMVEQHQSQAVCMSCHKKMDVIGFGLENFDAIGRWRETETVGQKEIPIQPGGTLPNGAAFDDVPGLKAVLLKEKDQLGRELVESLFAYGLGRTIEFSDATAIDEVTDELRSKDYPLRSMIHRIVAHPLFRTK